MYSIPPGKWISSYMIQVYSTKTSVALGDHYISILIPIHFYLKRFDYLRYIWESFVDENISLLAGTDILNLMSSKLVKWELELLLLATMISLGIVKTARLSFHHEEAHRIQAMPRSHSWLRWQRIFVGAPLLLAQLRFVWRKLCGPKGRDSIIKWYVEYWIDSCYVCLCDIPNHSRRRHLEVHTACEESFCMASLV